jgi:cysteinyl-tRNA synthetase
MPLAMGGLWNLLHDKAVSATDKYQAVERADAVLALDLLKTDEADVNNISVATEHVQFELISTKKVEPATTDQIAKLIEERASAKMLKNYTRADAVRVQLKEMGIEVKDLPGGKIQCIVNEK